PTQRRLDARHEAHGAHVGVLLEAAPDRNQESPERDMVGHSGKSDGAEEYAVVVADAIEPILGHHAAGLRVVFAAPGQLVPFERDAESRPRGFEDANALGHDLLADAVAGDERDPVAPHAASGAASAADR